MSSHKRRIISVVRSGLAVATQGLSLVLGLAPLFIRAETEGTVREWRIPPGQEPREQRTPPYLVERNLSNDPLLQKGYLNVRHYARGDGISDDTQMIRQALADGLTYGLAVYFPSGTYLVSDTLDCYKKQKSYVRGFFILGDPTNRPVIKLKDGAPGFADAENPRYVVKLWQWDERSNRPDREYGAAFMNSAGVSSIIIDCGTGNPGAIGLKCWASQGVYIENLTVRAYGALAGIRDLIGNGGFMANIEVKGGRYGIWAVNGQPGCIAGLTLIDQEEAAIRQNMSTWPYSVVGFKIVKERGPVVVIERKPAQNQGYHLSFVDGTVELKTAGTAFEVQKDGLGRAASLYLRDVYLKNADCLVAEEGSVPVVAPSGPWSHVIEYASSSMDTQSIVDGRPIDGPVVRIDGQSPPDSLMARHMLAPYALPFGLDPDACNVRDVSRGTNRAAGDGIGDDTAAIQDAIDHHQKVFLPRGIYRLTAPLRLRKDSVLFGLTSALSAVYADAQNWQTGQERSVITTIDDPSARCVVSQLFVYTSSTDPVGGHRVIHWRAGRDSIVKNLFTKSVDWPGIGWPSVKLDWARGDLRPVNVGQLALIEGNGGGRWYGISIGCENYCPVVPRGYRHYSVIGTHEPLRFYSLNPEHACSDAEFEIRDSRNVAIYGVKTEGGQEPLSYNSFGIGVGALFRITGSRNIFITAVGNNGKAPDHDQALFEIERTEDIAITTVSVAPRGSREYRILDVVDARERSRLVPATQNLGLYRRGDPLR
jgi:hypothetical protein